jgi:DNA-binding transcriptional MerR regulator
MYLRGQFAIIGKVGRKALRLYEEQGILVPHEINQENGYRYYKESQIEELYQIQKYKRYGFSLEEIREIKINHISEKEMLCKRVAEISKEIQDSIFIKDEIEKRLNKEEEELSDSNSKKETKTDNIIMKSFPSCNVLFCFESIDVENLGISVGKLYEMAARNNRDVIGNHYVRYDNIFDEYGEFNMQTCLPISELSLSQEYCRKEEECTCLYMKYSGGFSTVGNAHQVLEKHAELNSIILEGTVFEVYNKDMSVELYYIVCRI